MKKRHYVWIGLLGCLPFTGAYAQDTEYEIIEDSVGYAISLLEGTSGSGSTQRALRILSECTEREDSKAMNALGLVYMRGLGVEADSEKAIQWLEKAGEAGYPRAYQNLGTMYKYARCGVPQDFEKAYAYFLKAVQVGGVSALYDTGYMLYKGFGCKQSYPEAARYFEEGANHDFPPCMYMLGLCYRNGYGKEKDTERARFWLDRAARFNYRSAFEELTMHESENSYLALEVSANDTVTAPRQYSKVEAVARTPELNGNYQGILAIYDWSGQYLIKEKILELDLTTRDTLVTGLWKEEKDTVWIKATLKDGVLSFQDTRQKRADRYSPGDPILYEFTEAIIEPVGSSLIGNIRMYSPRTMEPERPMYMNLQKVLPPTAEKTKNKPGSSKSLPLPGQDTEKLRAYPNPFTGTIYVRFALEEAASVQLALYDHSGKNVYMSSKQALPAGEQTLSLTPKVPAGVYIVKVYAPNHTWQTIVVKKGGE